MVKLAQYYIDINGGAPDYGLGWICSGGSKGASWPLSPCNFNAKLVQAANWTLNPGSEASSTVSIQYCPSEPTEKHCTFQFNITIMSLVISCNLVKMLCMLTILLYHTSKPLATLGDAIKSFLMKDAPATEQMCLAENGTLVSNGSWSASSRKWEPKTTALVSQRQLEAVANL